MEFWKILVPALLVVLGWFANSWLAFERERKQKKFELVNRHLIDAYRRLERSSNRDGSIAHEYWDDMESAIADIFLFGSKNSVHLARKFADEMGAINSASLDELLNILRAELRKNLKLDSVDANIVYLRFKKSSES